MGLLSLARGDPIACWDLTLNELLLARRTGSLAGFSLASRFQLAKRQPVLAFGGAAIGSLVLVLFFAGAAKILNQHSKLASGRAVATQSATAGTGTLSESSKASTGEPVQETTSPPSGAAQPPVPAEEKPEDVQAALAAILDVNSAVGHLFAGRLPEAEQAYRDLAAVFPGEPAFRSASRILARKNGPNCRGANSAKTAFPSVKP